MALLKSKLRSFDGIDVVSVPIKDLHYRFYPQNTEFRKKVKESLKEQGMQNPILCFRLGGEGWKDFKEVPHLVRVPAAHAWDLEGSERGAPENPPVDVERTFVMAGANRITAALELGYDSIDCVILPWNDADRLYKAEADMVKLWETKDAD